MTIDDEIRDEKLQYDINREVEKISALSGKIYKYEYLTDEEILSFNQRQIVKTRKNKLKLYIYKKIKNKIN